jgi:Na+/H+-dicarboxylate symporter
VGNGVATNIVAKWEKQYDAERAQAILRGDVLPDLTLAEETP